MKNEFKPRVRFMKFKDEWKLLSMKNFINNMYGGASITPSDYQKDGVPTVPKSAINSSGIANLSNSKFVSNDYCQKNLNSSVYSGDFVTSLRDLVPTAPNMGRVVKLIGESKRYLMPQGVYRLLLEKNVDENFLIAFSNSDKFRNSILKIKTGSTQVHIRNSQYLGIEIIAPSHEEQKKIGELFEGLNKTIVIHQQELEAIKQTKQGFLQKMFPREGESIPELRFPEFKSKWQSTTLSNVTNIIGGGTPDTKEPKYWDGEIDWYSPTEIGKNIYAMGSVRKITQLGLEKSSAKILPANKTILFTSRAGIGDTAILVKEGATNQGFQSLVVQDNCDVYFLYSMSNKIKNYALKNASGSTFLEISGKNLGKMSMLIPSMEEQIKIGEFFCQLDEVIELKKKELEALKETKKGFLQKMFV